MVSYLYTSSDIQFLCYLRAFFVRYKSCICVITRRREKWFSEYVNQLITIMYKKPRWCLRHDINNETKIPRYRVLTQSGTISYGRIRGNNGTITLRNMIEIGFLGLFFFDLLAKL